MLSPAFWEVPSMGLCEYLDALSAQIRCKKARPMIVEEIKDHIGDQAQAYLAEGMKEEEAIEKAVAEMGDPVEAGVALDRIHRPKMQWELVVLVFLLSLFGLIMQIVIFKKGALTNDTNVTTINSSFIANAVFNTMAAFLVMVGVCLLDYSFLGKHPVALWWCLSGAILLYHFTYGYRMFMRNSFGYYMLTVMGPVFAAIVFHYKGKGMKGFLKCVAFYCILMLLLKPTSTTLSGKVEITALALLILSIAIVKGWFGEKKGKKLALIWVPALGIPSVFCGAAVYFNDKIRLLAEYQVARIRAILSQTEDVNSISRAVSEEIGKTTLFGAGDLPLTKLPAIQNDYIVTSMFTYFGVVFTLLVLCVIAYFLWKAFAVSFCQKNQLGFIVGVSCVVLLSVKSLIYLLSNLGFYTVCSQMSMPFLSYGLGNSVVNGVLVGLLLSVYRNKDIISERNRKPRYVLRLPFEKVQ